MKIRAYTLSFTGALLAFIASAISFSDPTERGLVVALVFLTIAVALTVASLIVVHNE